MKLLNWFAATAGYTMSRIRSMLGLPAHPDVVAMMQKLQPVVRVDQKPDGTCVSMFFAKHS